MTERIVSFRRRLVVCSALIGAAVLVLIWPLGTWLQGGELWATALAVPDAIYLVAGAEDQDRRVAAVLKWFREREEERRQTADRDPAGRETNRENRAYEQTSESTAPVAILIGNDSVSGRWSREHRRNLSKAEWAVKKLGADLTKAERRVSRVGLPNYRVDGSAVCEIVPGRFSGTDAEMEALASYLTTRPDVRTIAVVTSPFHMRRAAWRLRSYLDRDIEVFVIRAEPALIDRAPWVVLLELGKIFRDFLGLSRARFLSREGWLRARAIPGLPE